MECIQFQSKQTRSTPNTRPKEKVIIKLKIVLPFFASTSAEYEKATLYPHSYFAANQIMGNCCCKPKPEQRLRNATGRNQAGAASLVVVGTNKPLLEFYKYFEDDSQDEQSAREKLQKRSVFWETQPSYSVSYSNLHASLKTTK